MTVLTLAQTKGGSGKSTLAACLVAELTHRGARVAALDLDPSRSLNRFIGRVPELRGVTNWAPDPIGVSTQPISVGKKIREMRDAHDIVVIDLMGAATNDTQTAIAFSDLVIIPSRTSEFDLVKGLETWNLVDDAEQALQQRSPTEIRIARTVVMTCTAAGAAVPRLEAEAIAAYRNAGLQVTKTSFQERVAFKQMTFPTEEGARVPHLHDRASAGSQNFLALFEELMGLLEDPEGGQHMCTSSADLRAA